MSTISKHELTRKEIQILQETLRADCIHSNIRLREGEYQHTLAKTIASFQLEAYFPNVKEIIKRAFGEMKVNDVQFIRKIQTILKKMEKSNIVKILPKTKPWDLQRYALTSFKFKDVDKNFVVVATNKQIKQSQESLLSLRDMHESPSRKLIILYIKIFMSGLMLVLSYLTSIWFLLQPVINLFLFILPFSISVIFALLLGKMLSHK